MSEPLRARPGFQWAAVNWGGPDEPRTERCSYCGDELDDDGVPLILARADGWVAEFCDHCQAVWFGMETIADASDDDAPNLGTCCMCGRPDGVNCLVMLDHRAAVPGHGWGCAVCGLPSDGAVAVLCTGCAQIYETDEKKLTIACRGFPASEGRIPIAELSPEAFAHDEAAHAREAIER